MDLIPGALPRAQRGAHSGAGAIPVEWNIILEGHLEVELREANRVLGRYRSADLALTTGEQSFHMLLPPSLDPFSDPQVEAHTRRSRPSRYLTLAIPACLCRPWANAPSCSDGAMPTTSHRRFHRSFCSNEWRHSRRNVARKLLVTSVVRLAPEDLPAQPLAYTPFDVMVLNSDAFKEAREGQLRALARWVKGGGSVCVFVTGGLRPHHVSFLNELAESSAIDPMFAADSDGNLLPGPKKISCLYSGLGGASGCREALPWIPARTKPIGGEPSLFCGSFAPARCRQSPRQVIGSSQNPEGSSDPQVQIQRGFQPGQFRRYPGNANRMPQNGDHGDRALLFRATHQLGAEMVNQLMPRTVRLIPFAALMTHPGLFLLMIGPVDYFVLGWLRRRRYTWILFPATSIAFMIATVRWPIITSANATSAVRSSSWTWTRTERRCVGTVTNGFAARDKRAVTELKDALWSPLNFST